MALPTRYFIDLTQPEIATQLKKNPLVILPAGSVEQHGPHLPMNTDTVMAQALTTLVANEIACDVAPTIPVGASGEHQGFAGLLSIGNEALELVVTELLRSARATWPSVVLVSGHGGNGGVQNTLAHATMVLGVDR